RLVIPVHAPPPTETLPLSLHDALPIWRTLERLIRPSALQVRRVHELRVERSGDGLPNAYVVAGSAAVVRHDRLTAVLVERRDDEDRKSTRLNSSHVKISYAVFCLKKKI